MRKPAIIFISACILLVNATGFAKPLPPSPEVRLQLTTLSINLTIMGSAMATPEQCVRYAKQRNPFPLITVPLEQLVETYYQEGAIEGIRPDVAFAQALHETGFFRYGGDVNPLQNNYCGLGATGNKAKGQYFANSRLGVRAQMQHLLAYASTAAPKRAVVDPRYQNVKASPWFGQARTWTALNGKWAVPGRTYGQTILRIHREILETKL